MKLLLSIIVICSFWTSSLAQQRKGFPKPESVRILKNQPTVDITYERTAKLEPLRNGESGDYVFLRLHNNTRWLINLEAADVSKEYGDVVLFYGVEAEPSGEIETSYSRTIIPPSPESNQTKIESNRQSYDNCNVSIPAGGCHVCSITQVRPNDSVVFSVPREYLCRNLMIYVYFNYGWEGDNFGSREPQHRVYFYGSRLFTVTQ